MGGRRAMPILTQFGKCDTKLRNTKIYLIKNNYDDKIYLGYTSKPLVKRFYLFKVCCETLNNTPIHQHLNNIGLGNVHIQLLEECACYLIKEVMEKINEHSINLTNEGFDVQQETINDKELLDLEVLHNDIYKEKCEYYKTNKPKEYYKTYPERIVKSNDKYKGNEKYIQQQQEKIKCDVCDSLIQKRSMYEHKTSKKHIAALKLNDLSMKDSLTEL